jgi:hypothetical protein
MIISSDLDFFKRRYEDHGEDWYCHYVGIPGVGGFSRCNYYNYFTSMWNSVQIGEWLSTIGSRITPFWITRGINYLQLGAVVNFEGRVQWKPFYEVGKMPRWAYKYSIMDWNATVQKFTIIHGHKISYRIFSNRSFSTKPSVLSKVITEIVKDKVGVVIDPFCGSGHDSCYLAASLHAEIVYLYDSEYVCGELSQFNAKQFGLKAEVRTSRFKTFATIFKYILEKENKRKLFYFDPPWTAYVPSQKDFFVWDDFSVSSYQRNSNLQACEDIN